MKTQEFGAYLQCHKNPYATYKCLESFRKFYPDNTVVLLSDNGYDYTEMAKYFRCIYIHSDENIVFIPLAWNFFDEIYRRIKVVRNNPNDIFIKYFPEISIINK